MTLRRLLSFCVLWLAVIAAGCASISKVESGRVLVRERLAVTVDMPWNRFDRGLADDTPTWTVEGVTVDTLKFYVGIKNGAPIAEPAHRAKDAPPLTFRKSMQAADVVALFQSLRTQDGSTFTLGMLEPAQFVGVQGFRFEYSAVRKVDEVHLSGVAYGAVRNGELFLIDYSAPRLGFFPKHVAQVEALAKSAQVKS